MVAVVALGLLATSSRNSVPGPGIVFASRLDSCVSANPLGWFVPVASTWPARRWPGVGGRRFPVRHRGTIRSVLGLDDSCHRLCFKSRTRRVRRTSLGSSPGH
jgi:hypothetical protein